MAPNLPSNGFDLLAVAASDIQVEHNIETQEVLTVKETHDLAVTDYWVWETNTNDMEITYLSTAYRIQLPRARQLLGLFRQPSQGHVDSAVSYLESKLTEFVKPDMVVHGHNPADTDSYWETTSAKDKEREPDDPLARLFVEELAYWDWPESDESKRDLMIDYILQGEEIRQGFPAGRGHGDAIEILCIRSILGGHCPDGEFRRNL